MHKNCLNFQLLNKNVSASQRLEGPEDEGEKRPEGDEAGY